MHDLIKLSEAVRMLQEAKSIAEVIDFKSKAEAVAHYVKKRKLSTVAVNDAQELVIRAKRHLGAILEKDVKPRGNSTSKSDLEGQFKDPALEKVTEREARDWRDMARVPEDILERYFGTTRAAEEEITAKGVIAIARPPKPSKKKGKPMEPPKDDEPQEADSGWNMREFVKHLEAAQQMLVELAKEKGNVNKLGKVFRNPQHDKIHEYLHLAIEKTRSWLRMPAGKERQLYDT